MSETELAAKIGGSVDGPVCFASGTMFTTPVGDVPVEVLQVGQHVLTASGDFRPVKWVGHRGVDCSRAANPLTVWPVCIRADAFAPGRPQRDLYVSPGHSVGVTCVDEILVPAERLVNGSSVVRVMSDAVTYWHVELDSHDVLLANGLPAESYLDMGNRDFFVESPFVSFVPQPDAADRTHADFCRPYVDQGIVVDAVRARLDARARALGWAPVKDDGLALVVDGSRVKGSESDGIVSFRFPASAASVQLVSSTFSPASLGGADARRLGVCLFAVECSDPTGAVRTLAASDAALAAGMHPHEASSGVEWRWTTGSLSLPVVLWSGLEGEVGLSVRRDASAVRGWALPGIAEAAISQAA